nr:tetratricopeptide repeat protein [uncultured Albidiferax sp.]
MFFRKISFVFPLVLLSLLGACTAPPKNVVAEAPKVTIEGSIAEANAAQASGNTDQAIGLLRTATSQFPTDKAPWLRMAQIKFDSGNYGEAIINAQEALQRDPTEKVANSIVTVSGLRLATKSLSDLRSQNLLSGTVKSEAQDLAKILRENLGETILVPVATPTHSSRVRGANVTAGKPTKSTIKSVPPASKLDDDGKSNPFGGLK